MKVKIEHFRTLKYCTRGVRDFFRRHDLDFRAFLKDGIEEDELVNTGDGMVLKAVEVARNDNG